LGGRAGEARRGSVTSAVGQLLAVALLALFGIFIARRGFVIPARGAARSQTGREQQTDARLVRL